jgi:prepilin-type processing-associated H-X9-DG protein
MLVWHDVAAHCEVAIGLILVSPSHHSSSAKFLFCDCHVECPGWMSAHWNCARENWQIMIFGHKLNTTGLWADVLPFSKPLLCPFLSMQQG